MTVSRGFLVVGPVYLIGGVLIGMYMGGSGDHSLSPAHAHINLLGFVRMMVFGLAYGRFPEAAASRLAWVHFWLHQGGAILAFVTLLLGFAYGNTLQQLAEGNAYADTVIYAQSTPYQRLVLTRGQQDLRLYLNGNLQFSSRDEYRYHEALVHPA